MASRATIAGPVRATPDDQRALDTLYRTHAPALSRHCLRLTGDRDAADDLMQEVFVRFIARFPDPPEQMNVPAYLHAMAKNLLWKQLRDRHEIPDGDIEQTLGPDDDIETDPERATLLHEQRHQVRHCTARLTGNQRRALNLREVEGRSYAEIASTLGLGTDAVAQVISRARIRLRTVVRRAQVDIDDLAPGCRAMLAPLSAYLDGRESAARAPEVAAHLAACQSCRETLDAYREAGFRLRGLTPLAPLAGALARVGDVVRGGDGPISAAAASLAAAAVIAVSGGGVLLAQHVTSSPGTPAPIAATQTRVAAHVPMAVPGRASVPVNATRRSSSRAIGTAAAAGSRKLALGLSAAIATTATRPVHSRAATPTTAPSATPPGATVPSQPTTPTATAPAAADPPRSVTVPTVATVATNVPRVTTTVVRVVKHVLADVPAVSVPAITVPSVKTPAIATPAVSVPSVTVPSVTTPAIATPAVTVPPLTTPAVTTPAVSVPPVTTPILTTPAITVPGIKLP